MTKPLDTYRVVPGGESKGSTWPGTIWHKTSCRFATDKWGNRGAVRTIRGTDPWDALHRMTKENEERRRREARKRYGYSAGMILSPGASPCSHCFHAELKELEAKRERQRRRNDAAWRRERLAEARARRAR